MSSLKTPDSDVKIASSHTQAEKNDPQQPKSDSRAVDKPKQFSDSWTSNPRSSSGSVFYDSDTTNLSGSANSTLKSDLSSTYSKPTREEALATLDNYILDVNQVVERAKEEEKKAKREEKEKQEPTRPRATTSAAKTLSVESDTSVRRCRSMPSVISGDVKEFTGGSSQPPQSCDDMRSPDVEVFSDSEAVGPQSKAFKFKKKHQNNSSMSSQISDVPDTYGIVQLNQLCKFLEGYKQLQMENTQLSKRIINLEENYLKQAPVKYNNVLGGLPPAPPRNSMVFPAPKEKPKKSKPPKFKGLNPKERAKTGYHALATNLPMIFSTRSFDNLKLSSSHNFEKYKEKQARPKKQEKYSHDDMEVGKSSHESEDWRNASVKSPSKESADTSFNDFIEIVATSADTFDSPPPRGQVIEKPVIPTIVTHSETSTPPVASQSPKSNKSPDVNKKVFPTKPASPAKVNPEDVNGKNIKKMTEWGALQESFPVPQMESNVDLLNHLETLVTSSKVVRKTSNRKKHGPGRFVHKKHKSPTTNMYLPSTPIQGFASTCLAAHAMANQLTLALNLSDLEALSTPEMENPQQSATGQPIRIP